MVKAEPLTWIILGSIIIAVGGWLIWVLRNPEDLTKPRW